MADLEVGEDVPDIRFSKRLGPKPKAATDKPRPLRVGFRNESMQSTFVEAARELSEKPGWKNVSVVPDLTPAQQAERKRLLAEAKKRNDELEADEEPKNFRWRVAGKRGEERLAKVPAALAQERGATGGVVEAVGAVVAAAVDNPNADWIRRPPDHQDAARYTRQQQTRASARGAKGLPTSGRV